MYWWEKTVEYYFVRKYVAVEDLIAPLDGNHEKASDAIFSSDNKWLLIEFKRSVSDVASELKKFKRYGLAKKALQSKDNHHLIIYGEPSQTELIRLIGRTYFSGRQIDLSALYKNGIDYKNFIMYVSQFTTFKSADKSGGGAHLYSSVVGVSPGGKIDKLFTLQEYALLMSRHRDLSRQFSINVEPDLSQGRSR